MFAAANSRAIEPASALGLESSTSARDLDPRDVGFQHCTDFELMTPQTADSDVLAVAGGEGVAWAVSDSAAVLMDIDRGVALPNLAWWNLYGDSAMRPRKCCNLIPVGYLSSFDGPRPSGCPIETALRTRKPLNLVIYHSDGSGRVALQRVSLTPIQGPGRRLIRILLREHSAPMASTASVPTTEGPAKLDLVVGGIAHDFNNLLVGILGFASLSEDLLAPDHPAREFVVGIRQSAEQAARLTRELLSYARGSSPQSEVLNLNEVVKECLAILASRWSSLVAVQQLLAPTLHPIKADPAQIRQVITNICLNASEAMGNSAGHLDVGTANFEVNGSSDSPNRTLLSLPAGHYARITVQDTGCGIEGGAVSHIFEPYFSLHRFGRGLGLAAVAGIVRGHSGAIRVESQVGSGTRFDVFLPSTPGVAALSAPAPVKDGPPRGTETILILDDEPVVRRMLVGALQRLGYQCLESMTAAESLDIYGRRKDEIDLVVLDLVMADMDGEQVFEKMRELNPGLRCVFSSGYTPSISLKPSTCKLLAGFIQKPYNLRTLAEKVREALDRTMTTRE